MAWKGAGGWVVFRSSLPNSARSIGPFDRREKRPADHDPVKVHATDITTFRSLKQSEKPESQICVASDWVKLILRRCKTHLTSNCELLLEPFKFFTTILYAPGASRDGTASSRVCIIPARQFGLALQAIPAAEAIGTW